MRLLDLNVEDNVLGTETRGGNRYDFVNQQGIFGSLLRSEQEMECITSKSEAL